MFVGVKFFLVEYTANKKARMTGELFVEWLLRINNQMKKQKRKVVLLIDNFPDDVRDYTFIPLETTYNQY